MKPVVSFCCRRSIVVRFSAVLIVTLAWNAAGWCGEIHDAVSKGDIGKVRTLLQNQPQLISSQDHDGRSPLHVAAYSGRKEIAELLIADKAEVDARNNEGETPLILAAAMGHLDVVELLVAAKAEINAIGKDGWTAWRWAKANNHQDIMEYLHREGAKECKQCETGERTPGP